tara:strand:- start:1093 stop:1290 length:198 start_codon:yes stop_codon:yes gene_type:complete
MMNIRKYKGYTEVKIQNTRGETSVLLLTDHDYDRCRNRAIKEGLLDFKFPILKRLFLSLIFIIYG